MAILIRGNPTAPRKEWPNRATNLIVAIPSLLVTTLAPIPSTDVVRAPLIQQAKAWPEVRAEMRLGSPLPLVADIPAPVVPAPHYPPQRFWWQPQDTSTSVSKTLTADTQLPFFVAPWFAPVQKGVGLNPDIGLGTAKVLTADKQAPFFIAEMFFSGTQPPKNQWLPANTSQSQSVLLQAIPAPFELAAHFSPQRFPWLPANTSQGLAKVAFGDAIPPFVPEPDFAAQRYPFLPADTSESQPAPLAVVSVPFVSASHIGPLKFPWLPDDTSQPSPLGTVSTTLYYGPLPPAHFSRLEKSRWLPADTSQGQPALLKAIAAPFVPVLHAAPVKPQWQPADTSSSSPKTTYGDAQPPVFVAPQFVADRVRSVANTTLGTPAPALSIPLPPGQFAFVGLQRTRWQPLDTSQSAPKVTYLDAVPAFVPAPQFGPLRYPGLPADTSRGTAKVVVADAQAPVFDAPQLQVVRPPQVADTSQGGILELVVAPFVQASHIGPQRFPWSPSDTSSGIAKAAFADAIAPFVPAPHLQQQYRAPWLADTSQGQSAVLKPIAPFVPAPNFGPLKFPWLPADTSQGIAKVAFGDAIAAFTPPVYLPSLYRAPLTTDTSQSQSALLKAAPFVPPPQFAPLRFWWQPSDTSEGTPKVAYGDAVAPFVPAPTFGPLRYPGLPADTSHGEPVEEIDAPFVPVLHGTPLKALWQPADVSAGTPKPAFADAQAPVFDAPQFLVERGRPVVDASHSTPVELFAIALPPGQTSFVGLQRAWWQPADTSASVPKPTYADKQSPTFVAPWLQVVRPPQVADTSQGSLSLVDTVAPIVPGPHLAPQRYPGLPANTSASSGKVTYGDAVPAIVPPPHLVPQRYPSLPADTSHGIAKVAFGDAVPAFVALPYFAPQRYPSLPADTSHSDSVLLQVSTPNDLTGDVGVLALTGIAGSVGQSVHLVGDVGALVLTGQAGSVDRQDNQLLAGSVGTLVLSGVAGVIQQSDNLAGESGSLLLTGIAGSIQQNTTLAGAVGSLVLTGQAGSVDRQDNQVLAGSVGTLVLAGQAGAVGQSVKLDGQIGGLSLAGNAGAINQSVNLVGSVGALSLSGIAGAVDRQDNQFLVGDVGVLTLAGVAGAVDVSTGTTLVGDVGQLALTGVAGAIDQTQNQLLVGAVGSLNLTGIAGSIPSAGQEIIVGPSRPPFFVEPVRLRLVLGTIRTAQAQTVRGHGFVDVLAAIRTAQASQSVRADASARVNAESNTSQINRSEAFGDARIRVSIVSQQSVGFYELAASVLVRGNITSGLFAADTPPEYDGPEDDDILPDLIRKAT